MLDGCFAKTLGVVLLLALGPANADPAGALANIDSMTPTKGSSGQTAVLHGSGFRSGQVSVRFGTTGAVPAGPYAPRCL